MFNLSLVADRAQTVRNSLARLRELSTLTLDEFRAVPDNYAIAEHHLRRALQALLDLGRHKGRGLAGYRNRLVHEESKRQT
ncbi:MAG TPA: hypothetical protein DHW14_06060 [Clostridiales bacterium]|nr:hypothetical protein [Clostridiales bacterium]